MVARVDVMKESKRLNLANILDNTFGRTLLVILVTATSGSILLLTFLLNQNTSPHLLKYAVVGAVGLIAGFSARRLLGEHTKILRLFASMTAVSFGLVVMDYFSIGYVGIDLRYWSHAQPDWDSLIQIGLGTFTTCLVLYAWGTPKLVVGIPKPAVNNKISRKTPIIKNLGARSLPGFTGCIKCVKATREPTMSVSPPKQEKKLAVVAPPQRRKKVRKQGKIKPQRKSKISRQKKYIDPNVSLVGAEEYRCPFCLELVIFNDPRGVEICPICKTHHHADCWEVTGVCQIPHYQE